MRYELSIKCENCRSELHQSCIKSYEKEFVTIACNCNCKEKNSVTNKDSMPISVALSHSTSEVTKVNTSNMLDEDKNEDFDSNLNNPEWTTNPQAPDSSHGTNDHTHEKRSSN